MQDETAPEEKLATFVSELSYDDLPDEISDFVESRFVDTVGVMLAGADTDVVEVVTKTICTTESNNDWHPADYGFVFGTAGHSLDFDDTTHSAHAHFSVTIIASILSLATQYQVYGRDAITAYTTGYESAYYLGEVTMDDHYQQGWHATSTLGTYAAAAAAMSILELDRSQAKHAFNIASSMPAGLRCNFGTMTKPVHAGHATRAGVTAALLAWNGGTATERAVSGTYGFMDAYTANGGNLSEGSLDEDWSILDEGVNTKKYPCCHASHAGIEATITLMDDRNVDESDIKRIDVTTSKLAGQNLQYVTPETELEAKFSMHYPIACAIEHGDVNLDMFDDSNIHDPDVIQHIDKIEHHVDSSMPYRYETMVEVQTLDGERYKRTVTAPPGMAGPLSDAEMEEKFFDCTSSLSEYRRNELYNEIDSMRDTTSIKYISELIVGSLSQASEQ